MKAGLARFASAAANHLGLVYAHWKPNEELPGGRIIVVDGPYFANRALHERVMQDNAEAGNDPIDMLVCVGPSGIGIPGLDGSRVAMLFGCGVSQFGMRRMTMSAMLILPTIINSESYITNLAEASKGGRLSI